MSDTVSTPPHHPTYKVRLSTASISEILHQVYPGSQLQRCEQLRRGESFNNRIYFLDVNILSASEGSTTAELVLKLSGHQFDAKKVQNEVGAFLLLSHFCATIPIAKIVAWSEDSTSISFVRDGNLKLLPGVERLEKPAESQWKGGWILQTRLPGRVLTVDDLEHARGTHMLRQLASHMAAWRTQIPDPGLIGNIRFADDHRSSRIRAWDDVSISGLTGLTVGGLLLMHQHDKKPLSSCLKYYSYQLQDQIQHLKNLPELAALRNSIEEQVTDLAHRLPKLPFLSSTKIRFSHMDFSPRNILVSENGDGTLEVTGILDFEFSAFLPSTSEFLNSIVNQSDDWPLQHYKKFMAELQKIEDERSANNPGSTLIDVPNSEPPTTPCQDEEQCRCSFHSLQHLGVLESIIGSTAPWWIMPTSHAGREAELEQECAKAAKIVLDGIEKLRPLWESQSHEAD
jgi:hypothetical protein